LNELFDAANESAALLHRLTPAIPVRFQAMSDSVGTQDRSRILMVTGAAGVIGSHLVDALIERGFAVRALDNLSSGCRENLNSRAEFIQGEIRERASIEPALAGVDCIFHTAALPRVGLSIERPIETEQVNVIGTLNVLLAARDAGVRRVVYSGSSSVYGEQAHLPLHEAMKPNPLSPYALQKLVGEQYVAMFHSLYGLQAVNLRYFSVYGPRMDLEGAYATVIGAFLRARREGRPLEIRGDGEQTRDFTHVRDVVRANLAAMNCAIADGKPINVARGAAMSINQIADLFSGPRLHVAPRPGEPRHTLADPTRSRTILGWSPEIGAEEGVRELIRMTKF
jgi:nucleoside-diphosphate-sugar epimerase